MSTPLFLLLILSTVQFSVSYVQIEKPHHRSQPSRSLLRSIDDQDPPDLAVDLNSSDFDRYLADSPASWAIVEFFAHWCPACRNYKPQYEKVARLFNGPDAVHPGLIVMTRVDCALKINTKLCDRFSVRHYPMLLWGPPSKFASGEWQPKTTNSEIQAIDDARTAERLLNWINKKIGRTFSLDDEKFENEAPQNTSDPRQIARAVYDIEEATGHSFDIILEHKMINSDTRAPLIQFLQLLVTCHPSKRCRRGSADILVHFDDLWPLELLSISAKENASPHERDALKSFQICGKDVPRGYWIFCRGSKNDTRGFSCGLWVLFHSISVRVGDGESHSAFTAICDFIHNFFICQECRQHFHKMCSSVPTHFNSTRDFALWLWRTHNQVNERLMKEEADAGTADPNFPKRIWPSKLLCPSCYTSSTHKDSWNEAEVFIFLVNYYGKMLKSSSDSESLSNGRPNEADDLAASTSAVAVPVGAALAIAVASCAFGALACFWRTQQKNRKYLHHHHHSLKNI
ncbi:sulfhydryl oxidase 2 isoform X1 [Amborella trichopoda]|uniref:sulfhydryl oxidase 2 isoform X1 n=1 Tax=Amborella trichopoda TaxID=13333 RepID=UPI0005D351CC|nr:sulfhydryl oxidase 2 isoform X1 [Amborella trichopoda]|eukprot:XP_011621144.1 sulfhydryl oxidase 2 isoform X1 [Amborella trichopoda]